MYVKVFRILCLQVKPVKGLSWDIGAIGNATFSGARLYDVLSFLGLSEDHPIAEHVQVCLKDLNIPLIYLKRFIFEKFINFNF